MKMKWWPLPLLFIFTYGCTSVNLHSNSPQPLDHRYATNRLLDCRSEAEARALYAPDASIQSSDVRRMNTLAREGSPLVEVALLASRTGGDPGAPNVKRDHVTCWFEEEQLVALQLNGRDLLAVADDKNLVFFDWDQYTIRSDGFRAIQAVADDFRAGSYDSVLAIGHTDRSGPPDYNIWLSQRRATAVKAALQSMGVPAARIHADWKGETRPMVPTPPGVREERNRRVEIVLEP
jgi:outer membrane protein OmpA-like peptidoglycan-associated protein